MTPAPTPRRVFLTVVGNRHNAPAEGDRRPALAALRLRELAGVARAAFLFDAGDAAARAAAEALAEDVGAARGGVQPQLHALKLDDPHAIAAVAPAVRSAVEDVAREHARRMDEVEFVASIATGTAGQCAALLDALDGLGARVSVVYDGPGEALSVWRSAARGAAEPALDLLGAAPAVWNVLVEGPTGAGKSHAARRLHDAWRRAFVRKGEFVALNAAAVPKDLLASELFGHAKGAFRKADGGTLFLDEIGDLPLELQSHLLTALDLDGARMRLVKPVGDDTARPVDVRLVVGTDRDLLAMARAGAFRLDLLGRLSTHRVALPALAEARHRIVIAYHREFERAATLYPVAGKALPRFSLEPTARQRLQAHIFAPASRWPWNHRDVMQSAERLCLRAWAGRAKGPPQPAVKVTLAHVEAEVAELAARWSALAEGGGGAEHDAWAAVEARVRPEAWRGLSQVERWELRYLLEARDATRTNADAWRYIAERNLLEGAGDPRSLHNASNAFDKRWRRYAGKLRPPR